ncbi:hypothetical protein OSH08_06460 [Kaistia geumhonensis]|uniref:Lipoprotein n=1 Tax=Kaistia geumhonensis TaxID=410839 RepID=A0ABU0M5A7_9HYPH|nr:hypothetical protein [Kaistia geumhonensis]MCX5478639.1 hypothetical protein [Kaistia geumhonensis]MDQ0516143.1 hypothetical protein [Kaistia geumhonensis]
MMARRLVIALFGLALLSGCNTWERYQASVEQGCREQFGDKTKRYNDCLKRAAAADRAKLRHQDQMWYDSIDDAMSVPIVPVVPLRPHPPHRW